LEKVKINEPEPEIQENKEIKESIETIETLLDPMDTYILSTLQVCNSHLHSSTPLGPIKTILKKVLKSSSNDLHLAITHHLLHICSVREDDPISSIDHLL
jgi:hypothetical protein